MNRLRLFIALFSLLTGCGPRKAEKTETPPAAPGTSVPLSYPILAIGREPSYMRVFASEEEFTTTSGSSDTFYKVSEVIDSQGHMYAVGRVVSFDKRSVWLDMGTSRYRVFVETKLKKTIDLQAARNIVSDLVREPRSDWGGDPERIRRALEYVQSYGTLSALIEGCSHSYDWR